MFYGYVGVQSTSYPKSSYSLDIMYVAFLLNGLYLFIRDVTFSSLKDLKNNILRVKIV